MVFLPVLDIVPLFGMSRVVEKTDYRKPNVFFYLMKVQWFTSVYLYLLLLTHSCKNGAKQNSGHLSMVLTCHSKLGEFSLLWRKTAMQLRSQKRNRREISPYILSLLVLPVYSWIGIHLPTKLVQPLSLLWHSHNSSSSPLKLGEIGWFL